MNHWIRAKSVGYGATVSGATSGCASCCSVTLAKSQVCFDYLHPQKRQDCTQLRSYLALGFPQKNGETIGTFTTVTGTLGNT